MVNVYAALRLECNPAASGPEQFEVNRGHLMPPGVTAASPLQVQEAKSLPAILSVPFSFYCFMLPKKERENDRWPFPELLFAGRGVQMPLSVSFRA